MSSVDEIVERLSRYDKTKYPPDSPPVANPDDASKTSDEAPRSQAEVDEIVSRLCQFDKKHGPPGSNSARQYLGYNRYDYYTGPQKEVQTRQVSESEMETILERLQKPYEKKFRGGQWQTGPKKDVREEKEVQEIFERLGQFEMKKGPPGSTGGRVHLGYNRFDYGEDTVRPKQGPFRSKEEVEAIISRLSTFDITKGPPGSRGHEKKS